MDLSSAPPPVFRTRGFARLVSLAGSAVTDARIIAALLAAAVGALLLLTASLRVS